MLNPSSKKSDLLAFLEPFGYSIAVHTDQEPEHDYLSPGGLEIEVVNPGGDENLYFMLEDEFTLCFAGWHAHYFAYESEYSALKEDAKAILENKKAALSVFSAIRWLGSTLTDTEFSYRLDESELMKQAVSHREFLDEIEQKGGRLQAIYWNPNNSYFLDLWRADEKPIYKFPRRGSMRYIVEDGKALVSGEIREYEPGLACLQYLYTDQSIKAEKREFLYQLLLEKLEADAAAAGFSSIFALCLREDVDFYLKHGYRLTAGKDAEKQENILSVKKISGRTVQKYLGSGQEKAPKTKRTVKARKTAPWTNPARENMWNIKMNLPVGRDQFMIVERIIRSLRDVRDNFLIVDFSEEVDHASYMQIAYDGNHSYHVEIHFEKPSVFSYEFAGKKKVRVHSYTQYSTSANSLQEAIKIFRDVLCRKRLPDISSWTNCTKQIYLENLSRETYLEKP